MKLALLSVVAVAGLALSSGTASAQYRGYGHHHYNHGYYNAPVYVTPVYQPQVYVAPVVTPYNAGVYNLNATYGPSYFPTDPVFGGFSTGGFSTGGFSTGYSSGYFGPVYNRGYRYGYGRRW